MCEPEEYEYEPQDEFAVKVMELVKSEVQAKITETVDNLEIFRKANASLGEKIRRLESQIRTQDQEMKKVLVEKEKEVKRELLGGFTIGDTVYYPDAKGTSEKCEKCNGTHKLLVTVNGTDEERNIDCNKCDYGGKILTYTYYPRKDVISSAHLEMNSTNKWLKFYLNREDRERKVELLFKTEEECQIHCDEKNAPKILKV